MSRSNHTEPEEVIARRGATRNSNGSIALPRIVCRKAAPGDIHPLSRHTLRVLLQHIPEKYIYGLNRIELRARQGTIGGPFGLYRPDEKIILLYSLPLEWHIPRSGTWLQPSLRYFLANVDGTGSGIHVTWPEPWMMSNWFFFEVLAHELGHHHAEQYHRKNSRIHGWDQSEFLADLHALRIRHVALRSFFQRKVVDKSIILK